MARILIVDEEREVRLVTRKPPKDQDTILSRRYRETRLTREFYLATCGIDISTHALDKVLLGEDPEPLTNFNISCSNNSMESSSPKKTPKHSRTISRLSL